MMASLDRIGAQRLDSSAAATRSSSLAATLRHEGGP
jgi:hypothetical protein